jgi:carbamoyl-phosphate synthase large subunit
MIIGAGTMQVPVIERASQMGHFVISIDIDENAPGNKYCNTSLKIDTHDLFSISEAAIENNIDGILTTSDYPVRSVAYVSRKMGLHGLTEQAAQLCTDKYLLRKHLSKHGFRVPGFLIINEYKSLTAELTFPLIVKPVDSSGSRGVNKINYLNQLKEAFNYAKSFSSSGKVIIEEFIEGREFSVETLTQDHLTHVIAITEKTVEGKNSDFFVETRHVIPAAITDQEYCLISSYVTEVLKSIGLNDSSGHTEVKLYNKEVWIIEIGARLGGDYITSDLVPLSTGVDMLENIIRISLGLRIDPIHKHSSFAGIQFADSNNYYKIKAFIKKQHSSLKKYHMEEFREIALENSLCRLGYFIVSSSDLGELLDLLDLKI